MNKKRPMVLVFALAMMFLVGGEEAAAQTPNAWGYSTGYGNVYGTYGLAQTMQSMYNVARAQARNRAEGKSSTQSSTGTTSAQRSSRATPKPVVRNHGKYVPNPTADNGSSFANALGDTPEERSLIKQIYSATKTAFDKEAAARGWKNNIAAGLTFFTVTAITCYHDADEPSDEAVAAYFKLMNATLDEIPEFAKVVNKDKQGFNNMLVGFGGILLASYTEAKQNNDRDALATSKKLAGMLIEMVLKTDPENLRMENGEIVMK